MVIEIQGETEMIMYKTRKLGEWCINSRVLQQSIFFLLLLWKFRTAWQDKAHAAAVIFQFRVHFCTGPTRRKGIGPRNSQSSNWTWTWPQAMEKMFGQSEMIWIPNDGYLSMEDLLPSLELWIWFGFSSEV